MNVHDTLKAFIHYRNKGYDNAVMVKRCATQNTTNLKLKCMETEIKCDPACEIQAKFWKCNYESFIFILAINFTMIFRLTRSMLNNTCTECSLQHCLRRKQFGFRTGWRMYQSHATHFSVHKRATVHKLPRKRTFGDPPASEHSPATFLLRWQAVVF